MDRCRRRAVLGLTCATVAAAWAGPWAHAMAATLSVQVNDRDGQPVAEVVVYATSLGTPGPSRSPAQPPVMRQDHEQFSPHILVVQTGAAVSFPNDDTVSHHVYSFSKAKPFELPLYKGTAYPPIVFDQAGIIDLGCNIHDHMEAHILVVDTPYFAQSAADGRVTLEDLPAGEYAVEVYTPRLRTSGLPEKVPVTLAATTSLETTIRFEDRLRPPHETASGSLSWSHY